MKFTIDLPAKETYSKTQSLVLDGLYSAEKIMQINQKIDQILSDRLKILENTLIEQPKDKIMHEGRDLHRESDDLKKHLLLSQLGQIVYELTWIKPLRFGFDQLIMSPYRAFEQSLPSSFLKNPFSLAEMSSCTEPVMGVLICLKKGEDLPSFLPQEEGHALFFHPELNLPLEELEKSLKSRFLLVAFVRMQSVFRYAPLDPENHFLKKWGYSYGDRLKDTLHPIVLR